MNKPVTTHYLAKGPVLAWRLVCTGKARPSPLIEAKRRKRGLPPTLFPEHSTDVGSVTCKRCITIIAKQVAQALASPCPHGREQEEDCDVCMGRGIWAMPDQGGR